MYRSPNIVRVIKSRRLGWAGHVARMEEVRSAFKFLAGKGIMLKSIILAICSIFFLQSVLYEGSGLSHDNNFFFQD